MSPENVFKKFMGRKNNRGYKRTKINQLPISSFEGVEEIVLNYAWYMSNIDKTYPPYRRLGEKNFLEISIKKKKENKYLTKRYKVECNDAYRISSMPGFDILTSIPLADFFQTQIAYINERLLNENIEAKPKVSCSYMGKEKQKTDFGTITNHDFMGCAARYINDLFSLLCIYDTVPAKCMASMQKSTKRKSNHLQRDGLIFRYQSV